ncbi:hypothetical protein I8748_12470 [Nostoc sp. CENA67]|uniref:Uncharacterized protein n=1 Tax=Amazonocrinis nigriterrae CENA67 TaxID=2794033 RepID=A0A8J7HP07_9NOST|nr:hypothetical protein [Amazonocrinis nigriterrae]MBH8562987.1 hypothetical protein [Amazonocrinis nigriterrae CENA67]
MKAQSTSILMDLAESQENQRTVNYDINTEWDWGGQAWAETFPPSTDLTKVLIADPPPDFNPGVVVFS